MFKPAPVHDVPNKLSPSRSLQPPTAKAHLVPGQVKSESYPKDFNQSVAPSNSHCLDPYKLVDPDGEYASTSRTTKSSLDEESSNWDLDDAATEEGAKSFIDSNTAHEEQSDAVAIRLKLQELFVSKHKVARSSKNTVDSASNKSTLQEAQSSATLPTLPTNLSDSTPKGDTPVKGLTLLGQSYGNAEVP